MSEEKEPRKASSVRHTRATLRERNRSSQPTAAPSDQQIRECSQEIVHPATLAQVSYFHWLGLRERTPGFVVMVAFVLEMIWRQIGSVSVRCQPVSLGSRAVSRSLGSGRLNTECAHP